MCVCVCVLFMCRRLRENHAAVEERANQLSSSSNSGLLVKVHTYNTPTCNTRCTVCYDFLLYKLTYIACTVHDLLQCHTNTRLT